MLRQPPGNDIKAFETIPLVEFDRIGFGVHNHSHATDALAHFLSQAKSKL